jgi:hypothetical protein
MGAEVVAVHHNHFSTADTYMDFVRIDSTNQTADETVSELISLLA